jgi:hypothetical protein
VLKRLSCFVAVTALAVTMLPSVALAAVRPSNDSIANAQAITSLPFKQRINIKGATVTADEPECFQATRSIWFKVTPATSGRIEVQLRRSDFSYNLSVWQGSPDALTAVQCERYWRVAEVEAGQTYYIRVASRRQRVGEGKAILKIAEVPPAPEVELTIDDVATIDSQTEQVTVTGSITCSVETNVSYSGTLRQPTEDRRFVIGYFEGWIEGCGPTPTPISETFFGDGVFVDGGASLESSYYVCSRYDTVSDRSVKPITLSH